MDQDNMQLIGLAILFRYFAYFVPALFIVFNVLRKFNQVRFHGT